VSKQIKFHLDEHINPDIAKGLRRYGIDVTTTVEVGLRTKSDSEQLNFAFKEQRIFITHEADFLRMASLGVKHYGIVYCHKTECVIGKVIDYLVLMYEVLTPGEMFGKIEKDAFIVQKGIVSSVNLATDKGWFSEGKVAFVEAWNSLQRGFAMRCLTYHCPDLSEKPRRPVNSNVGLLCHNSSSKLRGVQFGV
jgi:predicted nuclease of predicted toxin-antitoxin system